MKGYGEGKSLSLNAMNQYMETSTVNFDARVTLRIFLEVEYTLCAHPSDEFHNLLFGSAVL